MRMMHSAQNVIVKASGELEPTGLACIAGFFFAFRVVLVLFFVRVLGLEPGTGSEITLALGLFLFLLTCFNAPRYPRIAFRSMLSVASIRWVFIFLAVSFCSLGWSVTVSLSTSIAYWCGMAADVGIVVILLRAGSVTGIAHALMKGFVIGACCIALVAWLMPLQADLRLGDEDFFNANQIGNLCAIAIFFVQCIMCRRGGKWSIATFFLAVTLLRSLSKTTIVAFLLSESVFVIRNRFMNRKTKIWIALAALLFFFVFGGLLEAYYDIYTTTGNQAETLTGRTAIWAYVLDEAIDRPWSGHGFDSMWKVIPPFGPDAFQARHAENEMLQQFYAYGVVGVLMLVAIYGSVYQQIRKLPRGNLRLTFLSLLIFIVVRGLAEAEPFDLLLPLWSIILISLIADSAYLLHERAHSYGAQQLSSDCNF